MICALLILKEYCVAFESLTLVVVRKCPSCFGGGPSNLWGRSLVWIQGMTDRYIVNVSALWRVKTSPCNQSGIHIKEQKPNTVGGSIVQKSNTIALGDLLSCQYPETKKMKNKSNTWKGQSENREKMIPESQDAPKAIIQRVLMNLRQQILQWAGTIIEGSNRGKGSPS